MFKDNYLESEKNKYALKVCDWYQRENTLELMEFIFRVLGTKGIQIIHSGVKNEVEKLIAMIENDEPLRNTSESTRKMYRRRQMLTNKNYKDKGQLLDDINYVKNKTEEYIYSPTDYAYQVVELIRFDKTARDNCLLLIEKVFKDRISRRSGKNLSGSYLKHLKDLEKTFNLTPDESRVVTLYYLTENDSDVEASFNGGNYGLDSPRNIKLVSDLLEIPVTRLKESLRSKGILRSASIISKSSRRGVIEIEDGVSEFLSGVGESNLFDTFFSAAKADFGLSSNEIISNKDAELVKKLLSTEGPTNILFHGAPGAGKTALAYSLAKELEVPLFELKQTDEYDGENLNSRKAGLVAAQRLLGSRKCVLLVDEADELIAKTDPFSFFFGSASGKEDKKSWINQYLENSGIKVIWITNHCSSMDVSTKRRFSYIEEFLELNQAQRESVFIKQQELRGIKLFSKNEISEVSRNYRVSAGTITTALNESMRINGGKKAQKLIALDIIKSHQKFIKGEKKFLKFKKDTYDVGVLNTDVHIQGLIKTLEGFKKESEKEREDCPYNMNILFQGAPGTGKTEFAKYLADHLKCELILKRATDIKSMWVGKSEQNIAKFFQEAERSGAILFLDEADSLICPRENAVRSWEISQTNELLTQMENFKGILICNTNFVEKLDSAAIRRFNYKVKFDYLKSEGKLLLFNKFFKRELKEDEKLELAKIPNLTPGDFKVVHQKNYFIEQVATEKYLEDLWTESKYKSGSKKIGLA